jgi:hypothetical protein
MLNLVTGPGGTAPKAQTMGYSVGGKTGTAHKQEGKGYADKKYRGFFVGMAPIENPRIVVAVMIDEPTNGHYFGGEVAAPVFSATVQQTLRMLGVQPDMTVKAQVIAKAEAESFLCKPCIHRHKLPSGCAKRSRVSFVLTAEKFSKVMGFWLGRAWPMTHATMWRKH